MFFVNNGRQLLTKSEYWPWNEEEYAPMPDGHMVYTYHLYNTAVYAYLEDFNYKMTDEELKEALLGDLDPKTIGVQWPIEVETRVSSPIKLYSQDSTMYANNLGVYARSGEKLFDFNMPMDDLTSNYRFGFSKDNSFFYIDFIPVAPAIPELNRRFIFPLNPELIIQRINNAHEPMSIAQLTNEDKARFLIE